MPKDPDESPAFLAKSDARRKTWKIRLSVADQGKNINARRLQQSLKTASEKEAIRRRNLLVRGYHKEGKLPPGTVARCKRLGIL